MGIKKNGYQTGIASEYLVLSMLYRLGVDAYLTLGNKKSIDIGVIKEDDSRISIDVKSVRGSDSIPVGNVLAKDNHFVVFVIYRNKFDDVQFLPDFYVVPSKIVVERCKEYASSHVDISRKSIEEYKNCWNLVIKEGPLG